MGAIQSGFGLPADVVDVQPPAAPATGGSGLPPDVVSIEQPGDSSYSSLPNDVVSVAPPKVASGPDRPGFGGAIEDIKGQAMSGLAQLPVIDALAKHKLGLKNAEDTSRAISDYATQTGVGAFAPSRQFEQQQLDAPEGFLPNLAYLASHPRMSLGEAANSIASSLIPSIGAGLATAGAGAVAGGLVGGPAGAAVGAGIGGTAGIGVGSAISDYGPQLIQYLADATGVDLKDQKAVQKALEDPMIWSKIDEAASKHAALVGAFDTLGAHVGGKFVEPLLDKAIEHTVAQKILRSAAGVTSDAFAGAAGEATGEMWATPNQPVDMQQVAAEFFLGGLMSGASVGLPIVAKKATDSVFSKMSTPATEVVPGTPGVDYSTGRPQDDLDATFARLLAQATPPNAATATGTGALPAGAIIGADAEPGYGSPGAQVGGTFVSAVREAVANSLMNKGTGSQWLGMITKTPGIRAEELQALNLNGFLGDGTGKILKDELLAHIEDSTIELRIITQPSEYQKYQLQGGDKHFQVLFQVPTLNPTYIGGHFDTPNVVGSVLGSLHKDENGNPVLMVHELQSDLHKDARQLGYASQPGQLPQHHELHAQPNPEGGYDVRDASLKWFYYPTAEGQIEAKDQHIMAQYGGLIPQAPWRQNFYEIAMRRMIRMAADIGVTKVAWSSPEIIKARYLGTAPSATYTSGIPKFMENMGKKYGVAVGRTKLATVATAEDPNFWWLAPGAADNHQESLAARQLEEHNRLGVPYLPITSEMSTEVQNGLPLYSRPEETEVHIVDNTLTEANSRELAGSRAAVSRGAQVIQAVAKIMGVKADIQFNLKLSHEVPIRNRAGTDRVRGYALRLETGGYEIGISLTEANGKFVRPIELYATMAHEFGHIVWYTLYRDMAPHDKAVIEKAIDDKIDDLQTMSRDGATFREVMLRRSNAITNLYRRLGTRRRLARSIEGINTYWLSREEVFAEQVARFMTSNAKPLSVAEKIFSAMGRAVRQAVGLVYKRLGSASVDPITVVQNWLESRMTDMAPYMREYNMISEYLGRIKNYADAKAVGFQGNGAPPTASTRGARTATWNIFGGDPPPEVKGAAAIADHFNWFHSWALGLVQIAKLNPRLIPLQIYRELNGFFRQTVSEVHSIAIDTLKAWNSLGVTMSKNLGHLLQAYRHMEYLSEDERTNKVLRLPTPDEVLAMAKKYGVNQQGMEVFKKVLTDFQGMLGKYKDLAVQQAGKLTDPVKQAQTLDAIDKAFNDLQQGPYVPAMHFGDYMVKIVDENGAIVHLESAETASAQRRLVAKLERQKGPNETVLARVLPKDAGSLRGIPPSVLKLIDDKLELSPTQQSVLEELIFESSPVRSFRRQLKKPTNTPGYSDDFRRVYANYFFHGGTHLARLTYQDDMRAQISTLEKASQMTSIFDKNKISRIRNYVQTHFEELMSPKPDSFRLKAFTFHWSLGFNIASAALNLSQTVVSSLPFLGSEFGDIKAVAALGAAATQLSTYYKHGTLAGINDDLMQALAKAHTDGTLTEALAPELAGQANGRNLRNFAGQKTQEVWHTISELSAAPMQITEKMNRRITFRAAFNLAMSNQGAKYVQQAKSTSPALYSQLIAEGKSPQWASSYITAKDAVETTQGVYAAYARPPIFRGRLGSLFMFKSFMQQMLVSMWAHPKMAIRSILIMGALGGLMGIPGAEDLAAIMKALAFKLLGKDFDLERAAKEFVLEMTGGQDKFGNGMHGAELLTHGLSRYGFGLPALGDLVGMRLPTLDQSSSMGLGMISPVDVGQLFGPVGQKDPNTMISEQMKQAAGAVYGFGFALYKFLEGVQGDPMNARRWFQIMPRIVRNTWQAAETAQTGVYSFGAQRLPIASFDPRQTDDALGLIAIANGYTPLKVTSQWDRRNAIEEVTAYWDFKRQLLFNQMDAAIRGGDSAEIGSVNAAIRQYNSEVPKEALGKQIKGSELRDALRGRAKARLLQEQNLAPSKSNRAITSDVGRLFPDAVPMERKRVQ